MRVTKFVHSCLLVETDKEAILIDPGRYSWDSHLLNPAHLPDLARIVITHEHGDHYWEPALRALSQRFPYAQIMTNNDMEEILKNLNLPNPVVTGSDDQVVLFEAPHVVLPLKLPRPINIGVHIDKYFTHPGDALDIKHTRQVLALPVSAPGWVNLKMSLAAAVKLKPKKIIPVHDWHWHNHAREEQYKRVEELLAKYQIEVVKLQSGEPVEI